MSTFDEWCDIGESLKRTHKAKAIEAFDQAITLNPSKGRPYFLKASVLEEMNGKKLEATEAYRGAICLGYEVPTSYTRLGVCLMIMGRKEDALKEYDQAIAHDPKFFDAYRYKGICLMGMERLEEAVEMYQKAQKLRPKEYDLYAEVATFYDQMGKKDEAIKNFNLCLSKDSKNYKGNVQKGGYLVREEKYEEGVKFLEKALEQDDNDPYTIYHLATAHMAIGNTEKARTYFKKAGDMRPEDAADYCYRGQCYYALEEKEKAFEDFHKATDLLVPEKTIFYIPTLLAHMKKTLTSLLDSEKAMKQAEAALKKVDQNSEAGKKLWMTVKTVQKDKLMVESRVVGQLGRQATMQGDKDKKELEELKKKFLLIEREVEKLKGRVDNIEAEAQKTKAKIEELTKEVQSKMTDFSTKLDLQIAKLPSEDQKKIRGYFNAFLNTFSSVHTTSQVILSGQVQLDAGSTPASVLSFFASFVPVIGEKLSEKIESIGEFLETQEMTINAKRMQAMAPDPVLLSQLVGKAALNIVLDEKIQEKIIQTTIEDIKPVAQGTLQKLVKLFKDIKEAVDVALYKDLYPTPAEKLGHKDANTIIEKYIKYDIDSDWGDVSNQFFDEVKKTVATPKPEASSPPPKIDPKDPSTKYLENNNPLPSPPQRNGSCCNMF